MLIHWLARSTFAVLLIGVELTSAGAQAGPPCGPDLPIKCTPGKDAAIVVGIVGVGVLAAYLGYRLNHPRHENSIIGCTAQTDGSMTLSEDNTQKLYTLTGLPKKLRAGQHVLLRGKISADGSGKNAFQVRKFTKDDVPCEPQTSGARP